MKRGGAWPSCSTSEVLYRDPGREEPTRNKGSLTPSSPPPGFFFLFLDERNNRNKKRC